MTESFFIKEFKPECANPGIDYIKVFSTAYQETLKIPQRAFEKN